jgi:hypothetical protein
MNPDLFSKIKDHWQPEPVEPPKVDPALPQLSGLQRATESLRYSLLSIEWWLSPNGTLRAWLKINSEIGSVLIIPAVLVVPLLTFILWQVSKWLIFLGQITSHLILLPLAALAAGILIAGVIYLTRILLGR